MSENSNIKNGFEERFNRENMVKVIKAFYKLENAVYVCFNGKPVQKILRNDVLETIGQAKLAFIKAAKEEGLWDDYVNQENSKIAKTLLESGEFKDVGGNIFRNDWGDEYGINPITGLYEQTAWGF